jgi:predicted peroxiredoxin
MSGATVTGPTFWEEIVKRMRLVFIVSTGPAKDASRVSAAYHLASVADAAGVDAEVRLADDALLAADPAYVATVRGADQLRNRIDSALSSRVAVSVCPCSMERLGINDEQVAAIGARSRPLSDILIEVAEGSSVLVHLG